MTHFHFDSTAARSPVTYSPDYRAINTLLAERWNPDGVFLLGFVHSHPPAAREPSSGDLVYARRSWSIASISIGS